MELDYKRSMEAMNSIRFDDYQSAAAETAIYPSRGEPLGIAYTALGANGEAGEVAEVVKKVIRDNNGVFDDAARNRLAKEIGDVLWYLAETATQAGLSLGDIASANYAKLKDRKERGVLRGSGDER